MINQFSIPIGRTIGIIDRGGTVIACSDAMKVGDVYEDAVEELIYGQNCVKANGKVLRAINAESGWEHIVFVDGDDDAAEKYSELLAISIANEIIKAYHKGRNDAVRGKFDQDYLDDVHKTGAGSSPPGKAP